MDYKYKVSAIVPCYNSEQFLAETLDNLLGQTLKEVQIILMNDGSTDSTPQIIADYAAKHPNILALSQENAGVSAARNNGMTHATGKYTLFLDGDDLNIIIGRRGETLGAVQYLCSLAANNGGGHYKISLNIGNYREKREETLINLAKRVSAQALKTGKCRTLEPMNPYERRVIHTAVQSIEGVVSGSFGEGAGRRVVIAPEGVELKPRRDDRRRDGRNGHSRPSRPKAQVTSAPAREPKRDSDMPLYGKIN